MIRALASTITIGLFCACLDRPATSTARANQSFIRFSHIGMQDKPIGTLLVAAAREDLPPYAPDEAERAFVVSQSVMLSMIDFAAGQAKNFTAKLPSPLEMGTFEMFWKRSDDSAKYEIPREARCIYLRGLRTIAAADKSAELDEALRTTFKRVECQE